MLDRADCADFGCHNSIRLETEHFLNTLALTFISFSGRFDIFFFASDPLVCFGCNINKRSTCIWHVYVCMLIYRLASPIDGGDLQAMVRIDIMKFIDYYCEMKGIRLTEVFIIKEIFLILFYTCLILCWR